MYLKIFLLALFFAVACHAAVVDTGEESTDGDKDQSVKSGPQSNPLNWLRSNSGGFSLPPIFPIANSDGAHKFNPMNTLEKVMEVMKAHYEAIKALMKDLTGGGS